MPEIINENSFDLLKVMKKYYFQEKRGNGYVIGSRGQRQKLGHIAYIMPLISDNDDIIIAKNEIFYTAPRSLRGENSLDKIRFLRGYNLTDDDVKQLNSLHPGFSLKQLNRWAKVGDYVDSWGRNDLIPCPYTGYQAPGMPFFQQACFEYPTKKYRKWLKTNTKIFEKSYTNKIPRPLKYCEELFDANVLVIKKLIIDIGNLTPIVHKERKIFFLYGGSSIITHIFSTKVNKKLQSYGLISLEYDKTTANLINSKNRLKFNILNNVERKLITLRLEVFQIQKKLKQ